MTTFDTILEYLRTLTWDLPGVMVLGGGIFLAITLILWHRDDTPFDLRHVVVDAESQRVSLHRLGQFIALFVSTMVLWYEMMHGRMTEWLFTGYMLTWSGALLTKQWLNQKKDKPGEAPKDE